MEPLPDPSLPTFPPPTMAWEEVADTLLALAACDLDDGGAPIPRLAAFRGEEALTISTLRPFAPAEALDAVVELLALFVPLGADRVALALPTTLGGDAAPDGREQPADGGVGLLVGTVDAREGLARGTGALHALDRDETGEWLWEPAADDGSAADGAVLGPVAVILDARDELLREPWELRPQLERVLHLGHGLALSPTAAEALDVLGPPLFSPN